MLHSAYSNIMKQFVLPECVGHYRIIRKVGQGAFAVIALAINTKTNESVAIKFINRQNIIERGLLQYLESELRIMSRINHPSFPKLFDVLYTDEYVMVVMEYLPNGSIVEAMNDIYSFSYAEKIDMCRKIASGLEYLHSRNIAHRDIKPENIVFDKNWSPKIVDLGLCREDSDSMCTLCGTHTCMAPEIIVNSFYDGKKADMWSFAVTAHVLMTDELPFKFEGASKYVKDVKKGNLKLTNRCRGEFSKVIDMCLVEDPSKRASASDVVSAIDTMTSNVRIQSQAQSNKIFLPKLMSSNSFGTQDNKKCRSGRFNPICKTNPTLRIRKNFLTK